MFPRCDDCGELLDCQSDWLGRMFYLHRTPCVPLKRYKVNCTSCGKTTQVEKRPRSDREYSCGERCATSLRITREANRRREVFARWYGIADERVA